MVVAQGWALAAKAKQSVRAMWRSTDGGRTWRFQASEGAQSGHMLLASDREFIWLVRSDDQRTLTLYRSVDGLTWTSAPLPVTGMADGMKVFMQDGLIERGTLQLMLVLATRSEATTVVQAVPL